MSDAIYVYSGTGNSLQIAKEIASRLECDVIDIPSLPDGPIDVSRYSGIGFVFPVHYYQSPPVVRDAMSRMNLTDKQKVWAVMDYGTTPGNARATTFKAMEGTGADVLFSVGYQMPENYLMMFKAPAEDECERMCSLVPGYADEVCRMVRDGKRVEPESTFSGRVISFFGSPFYDLWRNTKKFRVTDACTSCGLCAEICPAKVIRIEDGKPVWTEPKCLHCAGCINRCPAEAIQYGKKSASKRRYVNKVLR